jgi:hypothetical protein
LPNLPVWPAGNFVNTPGVAAYTFDIALAAGTTFMSPANGTWQTGNFLGAVGQSNFASSPVNSTFDIALVQHEPGALCSTPMDCPFTQNYEECLRYYSKSYSYVTQPGAVTTAGRVSFIVPSGFGTIPMGTASFPRRLAKAPTVVIYSDATGLINAARDQNLAGDRGVSANISNEASLSQITMASAGTTGGVVTFQYTADTGW